MAITEISDWNDLDAMRNASGDFILTQTLDSGTAGYNSHASSSANGGSGWNPVSLNGSDRFSGQGYNLEDMYMDRSGSSGNATFTSGDATIERCGWKNCDFTVSQYGAIITGARFRGNLQYCFVGDNCTVDATNSDEVAGIIGEMQSNSERTVHSCYSAVDIINNGRRNGSLIGQSQSEVYDLYWDQSVESTGIGDVVFDGEKSDYTGLTTSEMQGSSAETNMADLDFTNRWTTTSGYPELQPQSADWAGPSYTVTIDGTEVTEVTIDGTAVTEITIDGTQV